MGAGAGVEACSDCGLRVRERSVLPLLAGGLAVAGGALRVPPRGAVTGSLPRVGGTAVGRCGSRRLGVTAGAALPRERLRLS